MATQQTLGQARASELFNACRLLGVQHVRCFDYGDNQLINGGNIKVHKK